MALQHVRQDFVLTLVGILILAEPLGWALEPDRPPIDKRNSDPTVTNRSWVGIIVALAAIAALSAVRLTSDEKRVSDESTPVEALAHVPAEIRARPVFNDYSYGGWLIFNHVRPFIDGRNDVYGDALLRQFLDAARGDPDTLATVFARYRIGWVIVNPANPVLPWLRTTTDWRETYRDKWTVVYVRTSPPA